MKKIVLAVVLVFCLTLGACNGKAALPSSLSQQAVSSVPSLPETGAESLTSPAPESLHGASSEGKTGLSDNYPVLEQIETVCVGDGFGEENTEIFVLSEAELSDFWTLLRISDWEVATDLTAMGYTPDFYIQESEQIWFFNQYEGKTLVVPSFPDEKGEKTCYYAPGNVISDVMAYMETLTPEP